MSSEEYFRLIAEQSSDFTMRFNPDRVIEWASPSVTRVLGWQPEEMVGRSAFDFIHADEHEFARQVVARRNAGERFQTRWQARCSNGDFLWLSQVATVLNDADGNVVGIVTAFQNIDEQVRAEQALADSERHFRLLAENASDGLFQINSKGVITWMSPAAGELLGWDDAVGDRLRLLDIVHPDDRPGLREFHLSVIGEDHRNRVVLRMRSQDGEYRHFSVVARPVRERGELIPDVVIGVHDITEQVEAREAAEEATSLIIAKTWADEETGLASRARIENVLVSELAVREALGGTLSLLLLRLDAVGLPDDSSSAMMSDFLRDVGSLVRADIVPGISTFDAAGRWRADEILVILSGTDALGAVEVGTRMCSELRQVPTMPAHLGLSCAVTVVDADDDAAALMDRLRKAHANAAADLPGVFLV